MTLAIHNLLNDKTRLLLSVAGVALAVMLILILNGFLTGMNRQITSYLDHSPGALLVAQQGVENLLGATSLLPQNAADLASRTQGVEEVVPILSQFVILDLHDKKAPAYMVGYNPEVGGGPEKLGAGREPETDREVIFDRVLAERHDLGLGKRISILGKEFEIVGLSEETTSWMTSFFFIRKSAAEQLVRIPGATSFLLVTVEKSAEPESVASALGRAPGVDAQLKSKVAANDLTLFAKVFSAPLRMMVAIAFLVGSLVVGMVIYTATVERQREYGVLKAIGAGNWVLYQVVTVQALAASLAGSGLGVLLAAAAGRWIMAARPQFLVVLAPKDTAFAIAAGLLMALLAALFPARLVAGLAPAEVFRK